MAHTLAVKRREQWRTAWWLKTALEQEERKYKACPAVADMNPEYETAQAWGYVVTAYSLLEQGAKALLHLREKDVPRTHALSTLFDQLREGDQAILREYYADYRALRPDEEDHARCGTLDAFLANLDGGQNGSGERIGSLAWRYLPTEQSRGEQMPRVSVNYLHEVVRGCVWILQHGAGKGSTPTPLTLSQREHQDRIRKSWTWLNVRLNSTGLFHLGDRWEVLWGPDYRGRYDLLEFRGEQAHIRFQEMPERTTLPVKDMRREYETFDPEQSI